MRNEVAFGKDTIVNCDETQRNSMLHFGSDEGAKMAATYHSIICTVKMQGRSSWEYLGKFFAKIFNGCRDFSCLRPDKIGLAICQ